MNKKVFGIKISTILTAFICIVCAIAIWMMVKYKLHVGVEESAIGIFLPKIT